MVLVLKCETDLKNSKECFLGCIGYLSGSDSPRIIIAEFPDYNTALKCYDSEEYQEAHDILNGHVVRHHQIVEGN